MGSPCAPRCAAVVVLYHPTPATLRHILSWSVQVDRVYAVDNSEPPADAFARTVEGIHNLTYLPQGKNLGIARALNIGAERAIAESYDWLLTMDQDSSASPGLVARLCTSLEGGDAAQVGIVSPFHVTRDTPPPSAGECREILTVMTSGNLLNLEAFRRVGPFLDGLFIDYVDHEYCLRLRQHGYRILQDSSVLLEHGFGNLVVHDFGIKRFAVSNHPPVRRYYITRNRLWVMRRYRELFPAFYHDHLAAFWRELYRLVLFEDERVRKIMMVIRGYLDYRRGKLGAFGT